MTYDEHSFDRLVATCLLIHLPEPEQALAQWRRMVRPGGLLSIYVPCDPGALLRLTRKFTTARKVRKLGFDRYDLVLAREHRNHAGALDILDSAQLPRRRAARSTIGRSRSPSWNLNFFAVYQVRVTSTPSTTPSD